MPTYSYVGLDPQPPNPIFFFYATMGPIGGAPTLISLQAMKIYVTPVCLRSPLPLSTAVFTGKCAPTIFYAAAALRLHYQLVMQLPIGNALLKVQLVVIRLKLTMGHLRASFLILKDC